MTTPAVRVFLKTLKREEIYAHAYRDLDHLRANSEAFIDRYYNRIRLHSALGYRPTEKFEHTVAAGIRSGAATLRFFKRPLHLMDGTGEGATSHGTNHVCESKLSQRRGSPQSSVLILC
jgi:hypothetical protein